MWKQLIRSILVDNGNRWLIFVMSALAMLLVAPSTVWARQPGGGLSADSTSSEESIPIGEGTVGNISLPFEIKLDPVPMYPKTRSFQVELSITPRFHCEEAQVSIETFGNILVSYDRIWTAQFSGKEKLDYSFDVSVADQDTTGLEVRVQSGEIWHHAFLFFVTAGDTVKMFRGNPRYEPKFPPPKIIKAAIQVTVDGLYNDILFLTLESPFEALQGNVKILLRFENLWAPIPGYRFIQAVDLLPEAVVGDMVTSLRAQIPYDERRLEGLNIQEPNIQMFMLNLEEDVLQWQKVPSEVDQSENYVIGSPRGFGPIGLFAIPGTGLIGDFNSDGKVGFEDFLSFVKGYGKRAGDPDFLPELDLNEDSEVGFKDFLFFAKHYGEALPK